MKKTLAALALGTLTLAAEPNSSQAVLKHREHNGIGYNTGYTTGELFLAPKWKNGLLPFLDLRGHVFDDGKFATNAGLGLRYNWSDFTLGGNFYYDFREASNINPHQLAGGLEFLWKYMDVRVNGYGPIASTKIERAPKFVKFSGNSAIFKRRFKAALPMIEGEIGFPIPIGKRCGTWNFYGALGPYYLFEKTINGIDLGDGVGGKGRLELNLVDRYKMTALATYDEIFKWTVQGSFAVSFPFRKRKSTANPLCLARNQLPYRQEIIPIQCKNKRTVPPFNIIFVDNTSSSNGTFESPYPTLALAETNSAPDDVIYVFRGDGTVKGMGQGITLQARQRFHGSGAPMDLDGFIVPALTFNRPSIRNTAGNAVDLSTSNTVAGFNIVASNNEGIDSSAAEGTYVIAHNSINSVGLGISLVNTTGDVQAIITNNHIFNTTNGGISISSNGSGTYFALAVSNNIKNTQDNTSIVFRSNASSRLGGLIARNTILNNTNRSGIFCLIDDSSTFNAIIKGNTSIPNNSVNQSSALNCACNTSSTFTFQARGNTFSSSTPVIFLITSASSSMRGVIENNRIFDPTAAGTIEIFPEDASQMDLTIRRNFISGNAGSATLLMNPSGGPDTFIANLTINNNLIISQNEPSFAFNNIAGGMDTISFFENSCVSEKTNIGANNQNGGVMIVDIFNNIIQTNETNALSYTNTDIYTLTCTSILGNTTNGALSLSATAPAALQVESSTATAEGVARDNTFPGGITTTGSVTFVDPGTCP